MITDGKPAQASRRWAVLLWGAAEASLFFIVPDVLIGWLALRHGLRAGLRAARHAALGALIGGLVLFAWADRAPRIAIAAVEAVPAVSQPMIDAARADIDRRGWWRAAFAGPASSTPFKVYAALAPPAGVHPLWFTLTAMPIRLPRFLLIAFAFGVAGWVLRRRFPPPLLMGVYGAGWLAFYAWFFSHMPG